MSNSNSTLSYLNNFLYCFTKEFFGSTIILIRASLSSSLRVVTIGNLPTNSGISPNFNKSCGSKDSNTSYLFISLLLFISAPNPIVFLSTRSFTIFSSPSKAPPQMNNMFDVFICINS